MKRRILAAVVVVVLALAGWAPRARADSTAAVLDVNGQSVCQVNVQGSHNPTVWPDGIHNFDLEWMFNHQLFCEQNHPLQGFTWIVIWMGV